MKRPLCWAAIAFFAALWLGETVSLLCALAVSGAAVLLGAGVLFLKKLQWRASAALMLFAFALALLTKTVYAGKAAAAAEPYYGRTAQIRGTLCDFPEYDYGKGYYLLSDVSIDGNEMPGKVRLSSQTKLNVQMDDQIEADVYLFRPSVNESYYSGRRIFLFATFRGAENARVSACERHSLLYYPRAAREFLKRSLRRFTTPEEGALLGAILTGDKEGLSAKTRLDFQTLGLSHMLAVSGLHLSVFVAFFSRLFRKFDARRLGLKLFLILFSLTFAAVTGFTPSIVRSAVMLILILLADLFRREYDSLNALGAAVLLICLFNPYANHDIGFLLSASATFGIIAFEAPFERRLKEALRLDRVSSPVLRKPLLLLAGVFSVSFCATAAVMPVSMLYFGRVSLIGPLTNLIFLFPLEVMLLLAMLIPLFSLTGFLEPATRLLSFLAGSCARIFLRFGGELAKLPHTAVSAETGFLSAWAFGTAAVILLLSVLRSKKLKITLAAGCFLLFFAAFFAERTQLHSNVKLTVLDGGNETSVLVRDGEDLIVIGTGAYSLDSELMNETLSAPVGAVVLNAAYRDYQSALFLAEEFGTPEILYPAGLYLDGAIERELAPYTKNQNEWKTDHVCVRYFPPNRKTGAAVEVKIGETTVWILGRKAALPEITAVDYLIVSDELKEKDGLSAEHLILCCYPDQTERLFEAYRGRYRSGAAAAGEKLEWSFPVIQ